MAKAYFSLPDIVEYTLIEKDHLGDRSPEKDLFIVEYIKKRKKTKQQQQASNAIKPGFLCMIFLSLT